MTGKAREKLHLIHLRCSHCNHFHYNTRNLGTIVVVNTLYPNDPLENRAIQHLSQGVQRCLNPTNYSEYYTRLAGTQNERVNMMETLELDMLTDTVSILGSMPPLESFSLDSSSWE